MLKKWSLLTQLQHSVAVQWKRTQLSNINFFFFYAVFGSFQLSVNTKPGSAKIMHANAVECDLWPLAAARWIGELDALIEGCTLLKKQRYTDHMTPSTSFCWMVSPSSRAVHPADVAIIKSSDQELTSFDLTWTSSRVNHKWIIKCLPYIFSTIAQMNSQTSCHNVVCQSLPAWWVFLERGLVH